MTGPMVSPEPPKLATGRFAAVRNRSVVLCMKSLLIRNRPIERSTALIATWLLLVTIATLALHWTVQGVLNLSAFSHSYCAYI
jgi:hypothetical protein